MDNYRIWTTYHKDEQVEEYNLHEDANHKLFAANHEISGKNINALNPVYSEMVAMWYVWKNNRKSPYVGFNHYRRQFDVTRLPNKGECQVYEIKNFDDKTIYQQYSLWHNVKDIDAIISILNEKYGDGNPYSGHILYSTQMISRCCFLMSWSDFTKLCKFLFPILDAFSDKCNCHTLEDWKKKAINEFGSNRPEYQTRVLSFLSERLISAWISVNLQPYIDSRNVAIVNYNTPDLVEAAIRSLNKHTPGCRVFVFDNSDEKPFTAKFVNVEVIDNTKQQLVNFDAELEKYPNKWERDKNKSNYGSAKHTMSVEYLMSIIPDGFVLMDSDILIFNDIKHLWNKNVACVGSEDVKHNVPLLTPFLCYLNVPMLEANGIGYYNGEKMWALSDIDPNQYYDTGAWLLEQVREKHLPVEYVNIWQHIIHLGHGSWREKDAEKWLEENKALWG